MWQPISSPTRSLTKRSRTARTRFTNLERLESRQLLSAAELELSSLLPANGGDGSKGFVVNGIVNGGKLGNPRFTYEAVGDVNGDGIDDLLIAAVGNAGTLTPSESDAYLIFGKPGASPAEFDLNSMDGTNGYVIHDGVSGDGMGFVGGGGGDLNHDGVNDLVLGAIGATPSSDRLRAGQSFVIYGGAANLAALDRADNHPDGHIDLAALDGTHGFVINGTSASDGTGRTIGVGDVNGDHIDDLIAGGHGPGGAGIGHDYVIFGRDSTIGHVFPAVFELSTLDGSNGFVIPALKSSGTLSFGAPGRLGDINGDGLNDLIIGDYCASPAGRTYAGQAYVIFGRPSFPATFNLGSLNGSNGFTVNGGAASDFLGYSVDGAGDLNGDGIDDVAIAAVIASNPAGARSGAAYVIFGKTSSFPAVIEVSTLNGSNGFALYGVAASDSTGGPVSRAGDFNNDGYDDLIVGAATADPNGVTDAGQSYVVYGRPSFGASLNLASLLTANGGDGSAGFALNGFLTGQNTRPAGIGDINGDGFADLRIGAETDDPNGLTDAGRAFIVYGKPSPAPTTKFYVVNDASNDRTYEYTVTGSTVENYGLGSGNAAPRGAASNTAGDKVWVVDANKNVYVYNTSGGLLGSWTAGSLASNATVEGITTNGTDVWIVDAKQAKVFRYTGAASRLSGSQNAASSFSLNSSNSSPKDIVTDGVSLWVINDSSTDKIFKYTLSASLVGSWTITGAGSSPTGITLDPTNVSNLWIVDSGTDRVYQYDNAAGRTSGSQSPSTSFALAAGNTNPQGIADPPAGAPVKSDAMAFATTAGAAGDLAAPERKTTQSNRTPRPIESPRRLSLAPPSIPVRQEISILLPLTPLSDQDLTLLAGEVLHTGAKRLRTLLRA